MALYKPTELKAFLEEIGQGPKKALSQNFLIDGNIIRNIVKEAGVSQADQILEIGPGPGALTEALLEQGAHVVAVETDRTLAAHLNRLQTKDLRLRVITEDALKVPLSDLYNAFKNPHQKVKLISNLPYHITTPLISRFIKEHEKISTILVMVQEEVARRMTAASGSSVYGSLTVFLNFYADLKYAFKVSRKCFYPSPNVDSAIVHLKLKSPPQGIDETSFFQMTRAAFSKRRKMLRGSLKDLYGTRIVDALEALDFDPLARPEDLSLEQLIDLHLRLNA